MRQGRRLARLLDEPLAKEALARHAGLIRNPHIALPVLTILAGSPDFTKLGYQYVAASTTIPRRSNMTCFGRSSENLASVDNVGVSDQRDLQEVALTLQALPGQTWLRLKCSFQYYNLKRSYRKNKVDLQALGWLIRGLAYPHLRLINLIFHMHVEGGLPSGSTLFEADHNHSKNRMAQFPEPEEFSIHDSGQNPHLTAETIFLPMLCEAPILKSLSIPLMSASTSKATVKILEERQLPLQEMMFDSPGSDPKFEDLVRIHRRTLRTLEAYHNHPSYEMRDDSYCEPMLRALVPTSMATANLNFQTVNLQDIKIVLVASPTVSTLIQRILTSLPNL